MSNSSVEGLPEYHAVASLHRANAERLQTLRERSFEDSIKDQSSVTDASRLHQFADALRNLHQQEPFNFWAFLTFVSIGVCLFAGTLAAIQLHENGWGLVWQSLVETFTF